MSLLSQARVLVTHLQFMQSIHPKYIPQALPIPYYYPCSFFSPKNTRINSASKRSSMAPKTVDDIAGLEFDWLAMDADGHVALFSTAGGGYAPVSFLAETNAHADAIEAVLALTPTTTARFAPKLSPKYDNTWKSMADRGFFAYDSDINGTPYRLVAAPEVPLKAEQLPITIVQLLASTTLKQVRFGALELATPSLC